MPPRLKLMFMQFLRRCRFRVSLSSSEWTFWPSEAVFRNFSTYFRNRSLTWIPSGSHVTRQPSGKPFASQFSLPILRSVVVITVGDAAHAQASPPMVDTRFMVRP